MLQVSAGNHVQNCPKEWHKIAHTTIKMYVSTGRIYVTTGKMYVSTSRMCVNRILTNIVIHLRNSYNLYCVYNCLLLLDFFSEVSHLVTPHRSVCLIWHVFISGELSLVIHLIGQRV